MKKFWKPILISLLTVSVAMTAVSGIFTKKSKAYQFTDSTVAAASSNATVYDDAVSVPYGEVNAAYTVYVSPSGNDSARGETKETAVRSIKQAQILVREYYAEGKTGDALILLDDGEYYLDSAMELLPNDTVGGALYMRSINPNGATVSGAKRVDKASIEEYTDPKLGRVWKIPQTEKINQLYVGENYGVRARYPDLGDELRLLNSDTVLREIVVDKKDLGNFTVEDFDGAIFTVGIMWSASYLRVKHVTYQTESVKSDGETYTTETARIGISGDDNFVFAREGLTIRPRCNFHFENSYAFLSAPGEWFWSEDDGVVYYLPYENETLDNTTVRVPTTEELIKATGKIGKKVDGVVIEGINFKYTANGIVDGKIGGQANRNENPTNKRITSGVNEARPVSAVSFEYAKNIKISGCIFALTGGGAVDLVQGIENATVEKNMFRAIGGNGVLGSATSFDITIVSTDERTFLKNVNVNNNYFTEIGWQDYEGCAVILNYAVDSIITHNTINNVYYSGISIGWGWVAQAYPFLENIEVSYNRVTNTNALLSDGGPIYFIGCQHGSKIVNNYVGESYNSVWKYPEDISQAGQIWWANAGIYLDSCTGSNSKDEPLMVSNNYVAKDVNTQQYEEINAKKGYYKIEPAKEKDKAKIYNASGVQENGFSLIPDGAVLSGHHTESKSVTTVYGFNLGDKTDGALIIRAKNGEMTQVKRGDIVEWTDRYVSFYSANYQSGEVFLMQKDGYTTNRIYATLNVDQDYCMYKRFDDYGGFTGLAKLGTTTKELDPTKYAASSEDGAYTSDRIGDGYTASVWSCAGGDEAPWVSFELLDRAKVQSLIIYARSDVNQPECRGNFRVVGFTTINGEKQEVELYKTENEGPVYGDNDIFIIDIANSEYKDKVFTGFKIEKVVVGSDRYLCIAEVAVI